MKNSDPFRAAFFVFMGDFFFSLLTGSGKPLVSVFFIE
ncbi:hypothetical protein ADIS_2105 [Lunatimonas lonarensis]|uniref:Uncharacterized protein n=1 Tax=Lunatimonas lonarensis TaxID=1232681 RepID=R7ZTX6_9BACT|nr:hypothetical protein ADIS_2105 [Lunatimonas lonarensis]